MGTSFPKVAPRGHQNVTAVKPDQFEPVTRAEYVRVRTAVHALRLSPELARVQAEQDADDRELAIAGRHWLDRHPEEFPA